MNNIEIENLSFAFPGNNALLKRITFNVAGGEIIGIWGNNGSGKTTLFNIIAGLLAPDEGTIKMFNEPLQRIRGKNPKRFAYVPDESLLYLNLSALENMNLFGILWGTESHFAKTRTESLLKSVGLWEERNEWVSTYSKGMRQKLAICASLLNEPKLLIMDEPFNGLDVDGLVWAQTMFSEYVSFEKRSIIFTSHTPEIVELLSTKIFVLNNGELARHESLYSQGNQVSIMDKYRSITTKS